jgi:hypothetical protein
MNLFHRHDPSFDPPTPHRAQLSMIRIGVGLFGAPAAWLTQFLLSEPLAAHACFPNQAPLSAPIWEGLPAMLITISIVCLATALLSGFVAWSSWRQFEARLSAAGEGAHTLKSTELSTIETGENRNRFLIKISLMSSFIFIVAVIFNIFAVLLVLPCSSWF